MSNILPEPEPRSEQSLHISEIPIQFPTQTRLGETRPSHISYHQPLPAVEHHAVKQSRDKAQYVRQQKGHSLILHLLLGIFVMYIDVIYISVSPNHYWHA